VNDSLSFDDELEPAWDQS